MTPSVPRPVMLAAAFVLPFFGSPGVAAAKTDAAREIVLREHAVVAHAEPDQLAAGFGVVAWVERSTDDRVTLVARHRGRTSRASWKPFRKLAVERRVDQRTGRVVVRVVGRCGIGSPECPDRFHSPRTLKLTRSIFDLAESTDPKVASDGRTRVVATEALTAPDGAPQPEGPAPASTCTVTVREPDVVLPVLADCAAPQVTLRGRLVLVRSTVPSRTFPGGGPPSITEATTVFDLDRSAAGWRRLGTGNSGKAGTSGVQEACLLDDGVAVLSGGEDHLFSKDIGAWGLSVVRAGRPAGPVLPTPQLGPAGQSRGYARGTIACSGSSVYASSVSTTGKGARERSVARVVRLVLPR